MSTLPPSGGPASFGPRERGGSSSSPLGSPDNSLIPPSGVQDRRRGASAPPRVGGIAPDSKREHLQPALPEQPTIRPRMGANTMPDAGEPSQPRQDGEQPAPTLPEAATVFNATTVAATDPAKRRDEVTARVPQGGDQPRVNLAEILPAVKQNNLEAQAALATYADKKLRDSFKKYVGDDPERVEELTDAAKVRVDHFDPYRRLPDRTLPTNDQAAEQHEKDLQTTARIIWMEEIIDPEQTGNKFPNPDISGQLPDLDELLSGRPYQVAQGRIAGKSDAEMGQELGISIGTTRTYMNHAREKVQQELLDPFGLKQLSAFPDIQTLRRSVTARNTKAVKVFGLWYTSDDWLPSATRVNVSGPDFHQLSELATQADVKAFRRRYPEAIVRGPRDIHYIRTSDLANLQSLQEQRRAAREQNDQ